MTHSYPINIELNDKKELEFLLESLSELRLDLVDIVFQRSPHLFEHYAMFLIQHVLEINDFEVFIDVMQRLNLNTIDIHYIIENVKGTDISDDIRQALEQIKQFKIAKDEKDKLQANLLEIEVNNKTQKI